MKSSEPLSIHLVDDDQVFTMALKEQINAMPNLKQTVRTFTTGEECLKNFTQAPQIVILDYYLNSSYPDAMNGLQVLKKIRQVNPETKVIMLSGQDKIEVAVNLIKYGAYDYVPKNDNVFLRTKLSLKNAVDTISVSKQLKVYKMMTRAAAALIIIVVAATLIGQQLFPSFFTRD